MSPESSEARDLQSSCRATSRACLICSTAFLRSDSTGDEIPRLDLVRLKGSQPGRAKSAAIPRPSTESSSSRASTSAPVDEQASKWVRPISIIVKPQLEEVPSASLRGIWAKSVVSIANLKLVNGLYASASEY